ncbi:flagellar basal body-associated FliL family protein [Sagittula sp. NFXS13]|uniref:flagellar basal body-associated FliL family protein n=1 Tax=Sagittula sp. NFXS13 TaxID=2819095 RepID=UPI0032DFC539
MAETSGASQGGKTPKKTLVLRLVALVLLCAAALAGGVAVSAGPDRVMALLGFAKSADNNEAAQPAEDDASASHGLPGEHIIVTPFQEIIVNITATTATGRETSRFLKLNLALAYDDRIAGAENIEARKLFLRDSFQEYLRQLNEDDLRGSIGLVRLKSELLRRARAISDSDAPQEFLIADLIVQ